MPDSLEFDLRERNLGGIIYLGRNLSNPRQIKNLTQDIKNVALITPE